MGKIVKNILEYTVIFEAAEEGGYIARVPALNDCATQGETFEETVANVKDAIQGVVAVMEEEGLEIPIEKSETIVSRVTVNYPFAIA
jgi:predicted RNase H-like HicB family nuclease